MWLFLAVQVWLNKVWLLDDAARLGDPRTFGLCRNEDSA